MRARISYANVMSTVACFVALGGGAYAAATIDSGDIAKNAVLSKHIKNNKVKGSDVKEATLKGAPPLAHAYIRAGAVVPGRSSGVSIVEENNGGLYCLRVSGTPKTAQVTVESASLSIGVAILDQEYVVFDACDTAADAVVLTGTGDGTFQDRDFFVEFN